MGVHDRLDCMCGVAVWCCVMNSEMMKLIRRLMEIVRYMYVKRQDRTDLWMNTIDRSTYRGMRLCTCLTVCEFFSDVLQNVAPLWMVL